MTDAISIFFFLLLAGTKILLAPGIMLAAGLGMIKTMIVTYIGALIGATIFYYFGVAIFKWWDALVGNKNKDKFIFSKKARAVVKIKIQYGIIGIAMLAPIISIPASALIIAKFFAGKHKVIAVYSVILIPISIGLTLLSKPVIQPLIGLFKNIFGIV
mgnify:CR=1 FL=1|tara:strand:- start:57684 stop:58157 length:474 start_codon:yes stop_codon:yes gene_type:complete